MSPDSALIDIIAGTMLGTITGQGRQGPRGLQGPRGRDGKTGKPGSAVIYGGKFFDESRVQFIWVSPTGNDSTGNGWAPASAYATVNRALRDLPTGWTAEVWIIVQAGTYTGNQTWTCPVMPGSRSTGQGTGRVAIVGDITTGATITGGVAGAAVAGTLSQFTYAVGAYTATVTDGSHYVYEVSSNWLFAGTIAMASTTPNLKVVKGGTGAFTLPRLTPFSSIFSGSITIVTPTINKFPTAWFAVCGIRFQAQVTADGVNFRAARFDVGSVFNNCMLTSCAFISGGHSVAGSRPQDTAVATSLVVTGSLSLSGMINGVTSSTFMGAVAAGNSAKLQLGGFSATVTTTILPAWLRQFVLNDFRGTGLCVRVVGGRIASGSSSAACTVTVTGGAAIILDGAAVAFGGATWAWTGTSDTIATLSNCSHLLTAGGYVVTTGGATDIKVGDLAAQAVAVRPTTDPDQLCRYT